MFSLATPFKSLLYRYRCKKTLIHHSDWKDCGPAVLLSVLNYWGGKASLSTLRCLCHTDHSGSTMYDLAKAARAIGFDATGVRIEFDEIFNQTLPCIAHIMSGPDTSHYIAIFKVSRIEITVGDPGTGIYKMKKDTFLSLWETRTILLLNPDHSRLHRSKTSNFKWLSTYLLKHVQWIQQGVFLGLLCAVLGLVIALFIRLLIDHLIPSNDCQKIILVSASALFLLLLKAIAGYSREIINITLNKRMSTDIYEDFTSHLFHLPKMSFDRWRIGDLLSRINNGTTLHQALLFAMNTCTIDGMIVLGSSIFLFILTPQIAFTMLLLFLPSIILIGKYQNRLKKGYMELLEAREHLESFLVDCLHSIDAIRSFSSASSFTTTGTNLHGRFQVLLKQWKHIQARISLIVEILGALVTISLLGYGAYSVLKDDLTLGQMMSAYSLSSFILPSAYRLILGFLTFQSISGYIERLNTILETDTEDSSHRFPCPSFQRLSITDGSFVWPKGKTLMKEINLTIAKGELASLWGRNGAGKSTLLSILTRQYPLGSGRLLLDGHSVEKYDIRSFRKRIAIVHQQTPLLDGTLNENILFGRNSVLLSRKQSPIVGELFTLLFEKDIQPFSQIGKNGITLSVGEKHLVGFLRAFLDEPDIILIDEAVSGFDEITENRILKLLKAYSKGHAVMIVTHDRRVLMQTDRIFVVDKGTIIDCGSPVRIFNTLEDQNPVTCPCQ